MKIHVVIVIWINTTYIKHDANNGKYIKLNNDGVSSIISIVGNTKCCTATNYHKETNNAVSVNNIVNTSTNMDIHGSPSCDDIVSIGITRRVSNDGSILNEINRSIDIQSAAHKNIRYPFM